VLSLAWAVAQLGWVAGPACMICFAFITYVSAALLTECYRCGDPEKGPRNHCYMDAVHVYLGIPTNHLLISLSSPVTVTAVTEKETDRRLSYS
jgi:amino acid permease